MTDELKPLPVAGYSKQSVDKVSLVNENKVLEERCLRQLDKMTKQNMDADAAGKGHSEMHDPRLMALSRTALQEAFMWMNRAIFKPTRTSLPEDDGA